MHEVNNNSTGVIQGLGTLDMINSDPYSFHNGGTIAPGLTTGLLIINNKQLFSPNSVLSIEVLDNSGPGSGHDELVCNYDVHLNGILMVKEIGGAVTQGRFKIFTTAGTIDGNFIKTNLPSGYSVQINSNSVELLKQ